MDRDLPIYEVMPQILKKIEKEHSLVIQAPPGAGKTTAIPLELMNQPWLKGRKIVMLEPRRLAVRNAAWWMARNLGEKTGERVGYSVHLDKRVSEKTLIEVVTEGVFLNRLKRDPELSDTALVIFDEFHERSLDGDLSLTLLKESREVLREDLKIIIMSATLDAGPVAGFLDNAPLISSEGKSYPIEIHYREDRDQNLINHTVSAVKEALNEEEGSILVFLPGAGEIRKMETRLRDSLIGPVDLYPLYGALSREKQERAIEPPEEGRRKVVLATSIAESSLTIKGIRVVIDTGLMRIPLFNPRSGMDKLETIPVSQASADQRAGRAGRLEPGVCYRLWSHYKRLESFSEPSIRIEDLSSLALTLARWGCADYRELTWLTEPNQSIYNSSRKLLEDLGAVKNGSLTEIGKKMSDLPLHPRLGAMVLKGEEMGLKPAACDLAALLSERDCLHFPRDYYQSDILYRIEALEGKNPPGGEVDRHTLKRIREYARSMGGDSQRKERYEAGILLMSAYPDRIAARREDGTYFLSNGSQAVIDEGDSLAHSPYLVIPALGGTGKTNRIFLAAALEEQDIITTMKDFLNEEENLRFDREKNRFTAFKETKLHHLVLGKLRIISLPDKLFHNALCRYLSSEGLDRLNWNTETIQFRNRIMFLRREGFSSYPDLEEKALRQDMSWLTPYLGGINLRNRLEEIPLLAALKGKVQWKDMEAMKELAPTHFTVPSGAKIPIDYSGKEPVLKVRIQQLFGLEKTPRLCGGKHELTIYLLSPASRPIQITRDLKSFWDNTYNEVKKDLKGRYPKHYWPDNPYEAEATNRVKRKNK